MAVKIIHSPLAVVPVLKALWLASDQLCSELLPAVLRAAARSLYEKALREQPRVDRPSAPSGAGAASQQGTLDHAPRHAPATRRADALQSALTTRPG